MMSETDERNAMEISRFAEREVKSLALEMREGGTQMRPHYSWSVDWKKEQSWQQYLKTGNFAPLESVKDKWVNIVRWATYTRIAADQQTGELLERVYMYLELDDGAKLFTGSPSAMTCVAQLHVGQRKVDRETPIYCRIRRIPTRQGRECIVVESPCPDDEIVGSGYAKESDETASA